jgi:hypothetical protein
MPRPPSPISDMLLANLKREGRKVIIAVLADSGIVDGTGASVSIKSLIFCTNLVLYFVKK